MTVSASLASRLKPAQRVPVRSEAAIQADILEMLRVGYPDVLVASIPNGGFVLDPRIVQKLRWQGLRPGMPDLMILWSEPIGHGQAKRGRVGFIEVKSTVGRLSDEQKSVHEWLTEHGHRVAVVRNTDELRAILTEWDVPSRLSAA